jgi:hypothetical protein
MPIADPSGGNPSAARPPCWWAKAMPPLWQYFSRLLKTLRQSGVMRPSVFAEPLLRFPSLRAMSGDLGTRSAFCAHDCAEVSLTG